MSPYPEGTRWNAWGDAVPPQQCRVCDTTIPVELTPDAWVYRCPNGCMTLTCRDGEWYTEDHTEPAS